MCAASNKVLQRGAGELKALVETIAWSGIHGYNPMCACDDCKNIREAIEELEKAKFIEGPESKREKLIVTPDGS